MARFQLADDKNLGVSSLLCTCLAVSLALRVLQHFLFLLCVPRQVPTWVAAARPRFALMAWHVFLCLVLGNLLAFGRESISESDF